MSNIREYLISESVVFRKTKEVFGGLSNMAPGFSVCIHDVVIPTVEHLYQACRFPNYPDLQWSIISEKSPMKAKWIGRAKKELTREDWDQVRFKVMQWVLELKLSQNCKTFTELLLSTENKPIVELTPKDNIWGAVMRGDYCIGVNALGRLLMNLRENYAKNGCYQKCVETLDIPDFKFLGEPIGLVCDEESKQDYYMHKLLKEEYEFA